MKDRNSRSRLRSATSPWCRSSSRKNSATRWLPTVTTELDYHGRPDAPSGSGPDRGGPAGYPAAGRKAEPAEACNPAAARRPRHRRQTAPSQPDPRTKPTGEKSTQRIRLRPDVRAWRWPATARPAAGRPCCWPKPRPIDHDGRGNKPAAEEKAGRPNKPATEEKPQQCEAGRIGTPTAAASRAAVTSAAADDGQAVGGRRRAGQVDLHFGEEINRPTLQEMIEEDLHSAASPRGPIRFDQSPVQGGQHATAYKDWELSIALPPADTRQTARHTSKAASRRRRSFRWPNQIGGKVAGDTKLLATITR